MLKELDLSLKTEQFSIDKFDLASNKLANISSIKIKTKLEQIPDWLINNHQIESLSFKDNRLTDQIIFNPFSEEPYFKTVIAERLNYIPEEIHLLKYIRYLKGNFLRKNGLIEYLPNKIGNLKYLESLLFSSNQIKKLPDSLSECQDLSWVSLDDNPLIEFPEQIYQLKSLETLSIGSKTYQSININLVKLNQLTKLGSLSLYNCSIKEFPIELGELSNLYALDLSNNSITTLPEPNMIKTSFPHLNMLRMNDNPIFEQNYDFCNKWVNELNNLDISAYFN